MTVFDRIKLLRNHLKIKQKEFSDAIRISQPALSQIENGQGVSIETLISISNTYNVNYLWLMEGKGDMFLGKELSNDFDSKVEIVSTNEITYVSLDLYKKNYDFTFIPIIPTEALAGLELGNNDSIFIHDIDTVIAINGIENKDGLRRGVKISGDSMYPIFTDKDVVVCKAVFQDEVKNGEFYIVCTSSGVLLKQVFVTNRGFKLHSINPEYPDIMEKNILTSFWKVEKVIRDMNHIEIEKINKLAMEISYLRQLLEEKERTIQILMTNNSLQK